jgi:biopolymer transport protein ExbB
MRRFVFVVIFFVSLTASYFIWRNAPEYLRRGGPLLVLGLTCLFLVITFAVERAIVLARGGGRGGLAAFMGNVKSTIHEGAIERSLEICKRQGGCLGNVIGAGLERYRYSRSTGSSRSELLDDTKRAIEEAMSLEGTVLERNLSVLSTIASIATMLGLLGTTIGMIRAFRAMGQAGAPDAIQLAIGISEALVNTALGLSTAMIGIVLYNYFSTRVDNSMSEIEETGFEVIDLLRQVKES